MVPFVSTRPILQLPGDPTPAPDGTRALASALLGAGVPPIAGPSLVVIEGPLAGERLPVRDGAVVGRGRAAELHLPDPLLSRRHALFSVGGGGTSLSDLGSKNGVLVNGRRAGRARVRVRHGDALALGASVLVFEEGPARAAPGAQGRAGTGRAAPEAVSLAAAMAPSTRRRRAAAALLAAGTLAAASALLLAAAG